MNNDKNFEIAFENLIKFEGGYTNGQNQIKDKPTNIGITQNTLDKYNRKFPNKNFPQNVRDLKIAQAKKIYQKEYWDNTKIPEIINDRIRNAIFDMNVMSPPKTVAATVQKALNIYMNAGLLIDSIMGVKTTGVINSIPDNDVADFMNILKNERMSSLHQMTNWATAKNGWTTRTMSY